MTDQLDDAIGNLSHIFSEEEEGDNTNTSVDTPEPSEEENSEEEESEEEDDNVNGVVNYEYPLTREEVMAIPNAMTTGYVNIAIIAGHLYTILLKALAIRALQIYKRPRVNGRVKRKSRKANTTERTLIENCTSWIQRLIDPCPYDLYEANGQRRDARFRRVPLTDYGRAIETLVDTTRKKKTTQRNFKIKLDKLASNNDQLRALRDMVGGLRKGSTSLPPPFGNGDNTDDDEEATTTTNEEGSPAATLPETPISPLTDNEGGDTFDPESSREENENETRYDAVRLAKSLAKKGSHGNQFNWRGFGLQVGLCFNALPDHCSFLYGPLDAEGEGGDIDFGGRDGGGAAELESDFDGRRPGGSNRTEYPRRIVFSSAVVDETKCNSDDEEKKDDSSVVVSTPRCEVRRYLPHSPSADETKENLEDEDDDDRNENQNSNSNQEPRGTAVADTGGNGDPDDDDDKDGDESNNDDDVRDERNGDSRGGSRGSGAGGAPDGNGGGPGGGDDGGRGSGGGSLQCKNRQEQEKVDAIILLLNGKEDKVGLLESKARETEASRKKERAELQNEIESLKAEIRNLEYQLKMTKAELEITGDKRLEDLQKKRIDLLENEKTQLSMDKEALSIKLDQKEKMEEVQKEMIRSLQSEVTRLRGKPRRSMSWGGRDYGDGD